MLQITRTEISTDAKVYSFNLDDKVVNEINDMLTKWQQSGYIVNKMPTLTLHDLEEIYKSYHNNTESDWDKVFVELSYYTDCASEVSLAEYVMDLLDECIWNSPYEVVESCTDNYYDEYKDLVASEVINFI